MSTRFGATAFILGALSVIGHAQAQNLPLPNNLPVPLILDLANPATPAADCPGAATACNVIPAENTYQKYFTSFVATSALSQVFFLFRHDPGYFAFDAASVFNVGTPAVNLLTNSGFEAGAAGNGANVGTAPPGWTLYLQPSPSTIQYVGDVYTTAGDSGRGNNAPFAGSQFWSDGAVGGYDGLSQSFLTTVGATYDVTFELAQSGAASIGATTYSQIYTNPVNPNGIDVGVYAGSLRANVPEPVTITLLGLGLAALGVARRRH